MKANECAENRGRGMAGTLCDLHTHTVLSDASRTVEQVMDYARQIGLKYIAITDHDTGKIRNPGDPWDGDFH